MRIYHSRLHVQNHNRNVSYMDDKFPIFLQKKKLKNEITDHKSESEHTTNHSRDFEAYWCFWIFYLISRIISRHKFNFLNIA